MPIKLPALRDRLEDVPALVSHFLGQASREGLPLKSLSKAALDQLSNHNWPGNVRELRNAAERRVLAARRGGGSVADAIAPAADFDGLLVWLERLGRTHGIECLKDVWRDELVDSAADLAQHEERRFMSATIRRGAGDESIEALDAVDETGIHQLVEGTVNLKRRAEPFTTQIVENGVGPKRRPRGFEPAENELLVLGEFACFGRHEPASTASLLRTRDTASAARNSTSVATTIDGPDGVSKRSEP